MHSRNPCSRHSLIVLSVTAALWCGAEVAPAQQPCVAPAPVAAQQPNIFSEQQEEYLGDVIAESMAREYRVSPDEHLTAYFQQIATRLLRYMPATQLHLKFFLVDMGEANAFNLAGGRIYVSTKLVAIARNEDELAGILAHEFGHMVVHQTAIDMSRELKRVLNVAQVSDRNDINNKFQRLTETYWRKPEVTRRAPKESEEDQRVADRLAIYATTAAGYSKESFTAIFDRITGTEGKTGTWLTDLFGVTSPEAKRLREMLRSAPVVPAGCVDRSPKASSEEFAKWRAEVVDYSGWNSQEILPGVVKKAKLDPPLRGKIRYLKYSWDGKYILAQDDGNIYVLASQPLKPLFQIDAPGSAPAQFSPDSTAIVFHNRDLRVEIWNISTHKRAAAYEIAERRDCLQSNLSPDGKVLACLEEPKGETTANSDMVLLDVTTGTELLRKKAFFTPNFFALFFLLLISSHSPDFWNAFPEAVCANFTPDSRYFLTTNGDRHWLVDLQTREEDSLPSKLSKNLSGEFAFLGTDRLIAVNAGNPAKSHLLAFPSGEVLKEMTLARHGNAAATHGDFVMIRPVKDFAVGVVDVAAAKSVFAYKEPALDVFDQSFVVEERDGELSLRDVHTFQVQMHADLPGGRLGTLKAAALSPEWKWLAVSEEGRGAVWNLNEGYRLHLVRGFRGAYFPNNYVLYADFPSFDKSERGISVLSLGSERFTSKPPITDKQAWQFGPYLVVFKPQEKAEGMHRKGTIEVRDTTSGSALWSKEFPKDAPQMTVDPLEQKMLLWWPAASGQAKDEMERFPAAVKSLATHREQEEASFMEVLDAGTGKDVAALAVETGKTSKWWAVASESEFDPHISGDWVAVRGGENQILVYSLSRGIEVGRYFGGRPVLSAAAGLLCLENEPGHVVTYDLNSGQELARWVFASPTSLRQFSPDGNRLFVLTRDQTTYTLNVPHLSQAKPDGPVASAPLAN